MYGLLKAYPVLGIKPETFSPKIFLFCFFLWEKMIFVYEDGVVKVLQESV